MNTTRVSYKTRSTAIILAFFFGGIGAHKFYTNKPLLGILYILFCWTFIPSFISFIDMIALLIMNDSEFDKKVNHIRNLE
jgi:TM2 domain-containing membrane protein YozV